MGKGCTRASYMQVQEVLVALRVQRSLPGSNDERVPPSSLLAGATATAAACSSMSHSC